MPEISTALAAALEAERDALNARFAMRSRAGARIDPAAFLSHLRERVSPVVEAVQSAWPERAPGVVAALYEVSLDLFAASLLGPEARLPLVGRVWDELLPTVATLLARQPQQVAACLSNAAVQVASQSGTHPEVWLARLLVAAPQCDSLQGLLEVGLIAAWQAGMVQFRAAALAAAARLPPAMAAAALGVPEGAAPQVADVLTRMAGNPWLTATAALDSAPPEPALAVVATVGAFSGFGGVFLRPPQVRTSEGRLFCSDGNSQWQLLADACGAWFRPLGDAPSSAAKAKTKSQATIDPRGTVCWGPLSIDVPHLAGASSQACDGTTLAVTIPTSNHIFLLGRTTHIS